MTTAIKIELAELSKLVTENCISRGNEMIDSGEKACRLLLLWLQYLESGQLTGTANCLISGVSSAAREGVACVALGLARPAINSLRLQIDLSLAWLYFKDHPVEWARVQATGDGFKLKTELIKYVNETIPGYTARFGLLSQCKTRKLDDPYRLLSAHIHGQSETVLPKVLYPKDIVATPKIQMEIIELQLECSEFLNDVFWSLYSDRWASINKELQATLIKRFKSPEHRTTFFA